MFAHFTQKQAIGQHSDNEVTKTELTQNMKCNISPGRVQQDTQALAEIFVTKVEKADLLLRRIQECLFL